MAQDRTTPANREEWLALRKRGIGASEAAAVVGMSKWMSATELWRLKTGRAEDKDLSGNESVQKGVRLEDSIREFFKALRPEYSVEHHAYDMVFQKGRSWLFATLDGELTNKDGKNGILEIKTATPTSKEAWEAWNGRVPDNYYCQILHQMLATGYDYAVLVAALFDKDENVEIRFYEFDREDCQADLDWLLGEETYFWENYVLKDRMPPVSIKF